MRVDRVFDEMFCCSKAARNEVLYEKKSHISLARYMVNSLDDEGLKKHRLSFLYWKHPSGYQTFFRV